MKKEVVISDIDILKPDEDNKYSDNIIRNLIGNYYLATGDVKYLWSNYKNFAPIWKDKLSLTSNEQDIMLSSNESDEKEIVTLSFGMSEWNSQKIEQSQINKLEENINNSLALLYFYGAANNKNQVSTFAPPEEKLIKSFGKYFYDYSLILPTPVVTNLVGQKNINESISLTSTAKVLPIYNYYDENFEKVAKNNQEATLFNYYSLYYYLLENLTDKKEAFLNKNVLPLLKKYKSFLYQYLQSDKSKEKLIEKLEQFQGSDSPKNIIAILPDALKLFNELDTKKAEQPFGIDVSFAPQPIKSIGTLLSNTSYVSDIEKFVINKDLNKIINDKAYVAEIFFNNNNEQFAEERKEIPIINLNNWLKDVTPSSNLIDNEQTIIFTKNEKDKESIFLQKIKKVLLQKKVDELIKIRKRTFTDIISGVPAYSEVLLYEINKYSGNQLLQTILMPNTEELDFYKYFDTQIKYDTTYTYDIKAWTLVVGNKYKYFDRVEFPSAITVLTSVKNSTFNDSEYFRWFRVCHLISELKIKDPSRFSAEYPEYFGDSQTEINFSRALFKTYSDTNIVELFGYSKLLNVDNPEKLVAALINKVKDKFCDAFSSIMVAARGDSDQIYIDIKYQLFNKIAAGIDYPMDILGNDLNIQTDKPYFLKNSQSSDVSNIILEILKKAGIFNNTLDINVINAKINKIDTGEVSSETFIETKQKIKEEISGYLKNNFIININLFMDGGFILSKKIVDITQPENINYGLTKGSNYYPRFYANKDNNNKLNGHLQLGVYNEPDIILAGLPYVSKTSVKVISAPPAPPEITIIPYKNVKNKIKFFISDSFFTYRDYPIYMSESDTTQYDSLKENEKIKYSDDGKITFSGDEPSALFGIYRLEEKPKLYKDFNNAVIRVLQPKGGGFEDEISPNKKYYYTFRAVDNHSMVSNPTAIYEIEIVENSGAIYPIINIVELYEEDNRTKIISFKDKFKINVNKEHILENVAIKNALEVNDLNKFGSIEPSIFGKNFKIRITSKATKKKIDINLSFTKQADLSLVQAQIQQIKKSIQNKTKKVKA